MSHTLWQRESLQLSHNLSDGPQINSELMLVVLSAGSPFVLRMSVESPVNAAGVP